MLHTPIALCGATLLLAIVATAPVQADDLPTRKPGLYGDRGAPMRVSRMLEEEPTAWDAAKERAKAEERAKALQKLEELEAKEEARKKAEQEEARRGSYGRNWVMTE